MPSFYFVFGSVRRLLNLLRLLVFRCTLRLYLGCFSERHSFRSCDKSFRRAVTASRDISISRINKVLLQRADVGVILRAGAQFLQFD